MTFLHLRTTSLLFLIHSLAWLVMEQASHAQENSLRGEVGISPPYIDWPVYHYSSERLNKTFHWANHATEQEMASLKDDDPLLVDLYLTLPPVSKSVGAVAADMRRRPARAAAILEEAFRHPPSPSTRIGITDWLRNNAWINPAQFLPLIRDWYKELKIEDPKFDKTHIMSFLSVWGYPEDEAILREIGQDHSSSRAMRLFKERLQRLKNGDSTSNPNIPPEYAHLDYVVKPVAGSNTASVSPVEMTGLSKPENSAKVKPEEGSAEQSSPALWLVWSIVILAAVGLLWLVLKKQVNPRASQ